MIELPECLRYVCILQRAVEVKIDVAVMDCLELEGGVGLDVRNVDVVLTEDAEGPRQGPLPFRNCKLNRRLIC